MARPARTSLQLAALVRTRRQWLRLRAMRCAARLIHLQALDWQVPPGGSQTLLCKPLSNAARAAAHQRPFSAASLKSFELLARRSSLQQRLQLSWRPASAPPRPVRLPLGAALPRACAPLVTTLRAAHHWRCAPQVPLQRSIARCTAKTLQRALRRKAHVGAPCAPFSSAGGASAQAQTAAALALDALRGAPDPAPGFGLAGAARWWPAPAPTATGQRGRAGQLASGLRRRIFGSIFALLARRSSLQQRLQLRGRPASAPPRPARLPLGAALPRAAHH